MGLLALILVGIIVWLVLSPSTRESIKSSFSGGPKKDPLDIARERYARGEITKEQFDQIKRDLQ